MALRYIGIDLHTSSCTLAVLGPTGRRLRCWQVEPPPSYVLAVFLAHEGRIRSQLHEPARHAPLLDEPTGIPG